MPEQIITSNVVAAAGGAAHSLVLKSDGSLWAMGYNLDGELGDGTTNNSYYPEQIFTTNIAAISAGGLHSLCLASNGSLWAMGINVYGQLGDGTTNSVSLPKIIVYSNVTAIAAGYFHSLFLKSDGSLWGMGNNGVGQLGDGTTNDVHIPEEIVASNVVSIAAGPAYSLFIKRDGSMWAMGQSGNNLTNVLNFATNQPIQIFERGPSWFAAGYYHSLFITSDGSLWASGNNDYGQLGVGTTLTAGTHAVRVVTGPTYRQLLPKLLNGSLMQLSYAGDASTSYILERSSILNAANWATQATNTADSLGYLTFTNACYQGSNTFWRIRSLP
ncbi:MAG: hypothetical protein P4N60_12985 [Verrucomicrobiae bacterium]|nr:hypothetical protein [Verrucomicrobiae bacterium]